MASNDDYISRPDQKGEAVPVISDDAKIKDPTAGKDMNSNAQLGRDFRDSIKEGIVVDEKTRGASVKGGYKEPGDKEGLPENDGRSRIAQ
ncbi:hypothetical protein BJ875DRAFT_455357 [Amylocarpus encephaloides]|uniref:Uncharacterized protein n=1 Tax=Amylocarpus encephaloides TaxID=45428 RepID=A0A9P7YPN1_9HELO|nr:hypothetical protein BJ875DRAFT_455357 [Amylocarpus encephaloides]